MLAGDVGFVDFYRALDNLAVGGDLVADRADDEVTFDDLVLRDLPGASFPDDGGILLGDEAHFVDGALGANAVDDADESVGDSDY